MYRSALTLAIVCAISACASGPTVEQIRTSASKRIVGRITDRFEMAAIANAEHSGAMFGALGAHIISQSLGTPKHFRYWVVSDDGTLHAYHSIETYSVGDCLRIFVPKAVEKNETWFLGEAAAEIASTCK